MDETDTRPLTWQDYYDAGVTEYGRRHPAWLSRLETENYYPIAHVRVHELRPGDIIDVREFYIDSEVPGNSFLTIDAIRKDDEGVYGLIGRLPNNSTLQIGRRYGIPMNRRRVVRYGKVTPI